MFTITFSAESLEDCVAKIVSVAASFSGTKVSPGSNIMFSKSGEGVYEGPEISARVGQDSCPEGQNLDAEKDAGVAKKPRKYTKKSPSQTETKSEDAVPQVSVSTANEKTDQTSASAVPEAGYTVAVDHASGPDQTVITGNPTKADAMKALQDLNLSKGIEAATKALAKFGAKRISEVKETDYAALIVTCNESL